MKKRIAKYSFLLLLLASCEALISFNSKTNDSSEAGNKDVAILNSVIRVLEKDHYSPVKLDDAMSSKMFDLYLERLDYNKRFLIQKDYAQLEKYRYELDDQIKAREFEFFELSNKLITERITFVSTFYQKVLEKPIDFEENGKTINLDSEKNDYTSNQKALKTRWCDYMTYNVFSDVYNKQKAQEKAAEKSDTVTIKTIEELEIEARAKVLKNHMQWFKRINQIDRNDRFSYYINCFTELFDPHTNFYPPKDKEDFDISMSGRLEGIGATLQQKDGYTKVTQIVPGSASWKQGELKKGDKILKVAQAEGEAVSIVDMPLDEAVRLIRGPKGSEVRLTVEKIDGSVVIIPIVRDIVVLEETYAKSALIENKETKTKTGYLNLPKFYADFNRANGRRCAVDVKKELQKLVNDEVDGIVIDLRNNGGGSLRDVVEIGGYFIEEGPVVQVKGRNNDIRVLSDYDPKIVYAGPLVIMIDQSSASASEILAAAMQDYGRAIIVGSESSYGKGTVQRFVNLDNYVSSSDKDLLPIGSIKYTMQKFYRINGGATQLKGVESDIVTPDNYMYIETGEKEMDHAMAWDEIKKSPYDNYSKYVGDFKKIIANSEERIKKDSIFQMTDQRAHYYKRIREDHTYPLSYDLFKTQLDEAKEEGKQYDMERVENEQMEVTSLTDDRTSWGSDTTKTTRFDEFSTKIAKDEYIYESIRIIDDIIAY